MQYPVHINLSSDVIPFTGPIFVGPSGSPLKYAAIRNHGRNCIRFPDPFNNRVMPELLVSARRQSSATQSALTPCQHQLKGSSDRKYSLVLVL